MNISSARVSITLLALLAGSCQTISNAPEGLPRVELEVAVNLDESYTNRLQGVDADLARTVADLVLSKADVGLRFYPVLSQDYGPSDPRPEYLMTVVVRDLEVGLEHKTVQVPGAEPTIETFVKQLDCTVAATISKRRPTGPALVVGRSTGTGSAAATIDETAEVEPTYTVRRDSEDKPTLSVFRADLLTATNHGLGTALSELVVPVDRELSLRSTQPAKPQ